MPNTPYVESASVRRLGHAAWIHPRGEFGDACGIEVQDETEIRLFPAGSNHLARNREIDGEDEHMGRIVFEHVAADHDDLGSLRDHADRRAHRGVRGLARHLRAPNDGSPWQAQRKRTIVRRVARNQVRESSQC